MEKARDEEVVIATEQLKSIFDELRRSGFTERQAIEYLSSYTAKTIMLEKKIEQIIQKYETEQNE